MHMHIPAKIEAPRGTVEPPPQKIIDFWMLNDTLMVHS